jgi:hypothetical protein
MSIPGEGNRTSSGAGGNEVGASGKHEVSGGRRHGEFIPSAMEPGKESV